MYMYDYIYISLKDLINMFMTNYFHLLLLYVLGQLGRPMDLSRILKNLRKTPILGRKYFIPKP